MSVAPENIQTGRVRNSSPTFALYLPASQQSPVSIANLGHAPKVAFHACERCTNRVLSRERKATMTV